MALAYFITFSTYGTWLHGTAKGNGSVDRHHNTYGAPFIAPDVERENRASERMTDPPYVLHEASRRIVRDAIVGLCQEKGWILFALHVRTNHVHVVVAADREPGRLMSDLKARASRELNQASADAAAKRWTRHGSTRHLFDEASVGAAVAYVLDEQGVPMAMYDPRPSDLQPGHAQEPAPKVRFSPRPAHEVRFSPRAAHEVSAEPSDIPTAPPPPPTPCATPKRADGREISGLKAYEE